MDLRLNFKIRKKIKIDTQIHTQKLNFLLIILNYLFGNLQEICKILKLKLKYSNTQKIENSNPNLNLWVFLGAYFCNVTKNKKQNNAKKEGKKI
jgi:hypothetical protein